MKCTIQMQSTEGAADYRGRGRKERREGEVLTIGGEGERKEGRERC